MTDFKYSQTSLERLHTCHSDLITICKKAIERSPVDITVVCGHRGKDDQDQAYSNGYSDLKWPFSKHNEWPSKAVDLAPYINGKIEWNNINGLYLIAGIVISIAYSINVKIRWGGAWNGTLNDTKKRQDLYHFEKIV